MSMYETFYPQRLWIEYPQDRLEENRYKYVCHYCGVPTEQIRGRLEGHDPGCAWRQQHTYIELED